MSGIGPLRQQVDVSLHGSVTTTFGASPLRSHDRICPDFGDRKSVTSNRSAHERFRSARVARPGVTDTFSAFGGDTAGGGGRLAWQAAVRWRARASITRPGASVGSLTSRRASQVAVRRVTRAAPAGAVEERLAASDRDEMSRSYRDEVGIEVNPACRNAARSDICASGRSTPRHAFIGPADAQDRRAACRSRRSGRFRIAQSGPSTRRRFEPWQEAALRVISCGRVRRRRDRTRRERLLLARQRGL